ncbi:MAG: acetylglutamate kinase [Paracoccaceae bacterium]
MRVTGQFGAECLGSCVKCRTSRSTSVSAKQPIVVKIGGDMTTDDAALTRLAHDLLDMKCRGKPAIVVHGGGSEISSALDAAGISYSFHDGNRITCSNAVNVVQSTLNGDINRRVVSCLNRTRVRAVGISGLDGHFVRCEQRNPKLGFVGNPTGLDPTLLSRLLDAAITPVVAPIAVDDAGRIYNINADTFAGFIAERMNASALLLMTNVDGVLEPSGRLIEQITEKRFEELSRMGAVTRGMVPKIQTALTAFRNGVPKSVIVDGRNGGACLRAAEGFSGVGTRVVHG